MAFKPMELSSRVSECTVEEEAMVLERFIDSWLENNWHLERFVEVDLPFCVSDEVGELLKNKFTSGIGSWASIDFYHNYSFGAKRFAWAELRL